MKIIVHRDKHGDFYYKASTPEEIEESSLKILKYNFGYYSYPEGFQDIVQKELDNPSGRAWRLLRSRSDHEYEMVTIENVN